MTERKEYDLKGSVLFSVDDLLTSDECDEIFSKASETGFASVDWEYVKAYRDCTRAILDDRSIADKIWGKLLPYLRSSDLLVRPFGVGTDGTWVPKGLNSRLRVSVYEPGGHFARHRDSGFVINDSLRSVYTVLIYLNDTFKGGETVFFCGRRYIGDPPKYQINPKKGTAVVFTHDTQHAGLPIVSGAKHILRTDIMFHAMDKHEQVDLNYLEDPTYQKAEVLYQQSIKEQGRGDPDASTTAFRRATELQARAVPSVLESTTTHENPFLNLHVEILHRVFRYLSPKDLVTLARTCKRAKLLVTKDSVLWHQLYLKDVIRGDGYFIAPKVDSRLLLTHDWYNLYRYGVNMRASFPILAIDIGSRYTRFCVSDRKEKTEEMLWEQVRRSYYTDEDTREEARRMRRSVYQYPIGIVRSVFYRDQGHYWSAGQGYGEMYLASEDEGSYDHREYESDRYYFSPYAPDSSLAPVTGQWREIVYFVSYYLMPDRRGYSRRLPIAYVMAPFCHVAAADLPKDLIASLPFVTTVDAATAVVVSHEATDGIVISCGASFVWIAPVKNLSLAYDKAECQKAVIHLDQRLEAEELGKDGRSVEDEYVRSSRLDTESSVEMLIATSDFTEHLFHALDKCPNGPIFLYGGQAKVFYGPLCSLLTKSGLGSKVPVKMSDSPADDALRGAQMRLHLPGGKDMFRKSDMVPDDQVLAKMDFDKMWSM